MISETNPTLGILLRLLSGLLFAAMTITVKRLGDTVPLGEIVFFRSVFAMIPLVIFLWMRREFPAGLRTGRPWGHVLRSLLGGLAMFASFAAVARLPVAEAVLVGYLAPVLTAIAGVMLLGERASLHRIGGIALGLAGAAVLFGPQIGGGEVDRAHLIGLGLGVLTALLTALALAATRSLAASGESPGAIAFYFALCSAVMGLATVPGGWWVFPSAEGLALLVLAGLFGGFAHIAMTLAFSYAEASRLAPFEYVSLVWAVLADLLIFGLPVAPAFLLALPLLLGGAALAALEKRPRSKALTQ